MSFRPLAAVLALVTISNETSAALLQVIVEGAQFRDSQVAIDGTFAGLPGDVLDIRDGPRALSLATSTGYRFTVRVRASESSIAVESTEHSPPNCGEVHAVVWAAPRVETAAYSGVSKLVVPEPAFGASLGKGGCALPSMAACDSRKIVLKARSSPRPAEIWIDGQVLQPKTDVTLSVPFCTYESTKQLVYRLTGHSNCGRQLALTPDATIDATCEMTPLEPVPKDSAIKK